MLTRKDFIKKANEFIELLKTDSLCRSEIVKYCEIAQDSNPRFDMIRFRDHIEKGLGWKVGK
jgi:hypothetical protein|tara:strand:+ start:208 stop:393 length:186 start_codon:yes stop_codon:yes gene_type:complete